MTILRNEPHNIHSGPLVECLKQALQRDKFIRIEHFQGLAGIAEAARVVGDEAQQSRRHTMRGQHIVLARVLDCAEIILGRNLADGNQLEAFRLAAWGMEKQIAEVARTLGFAQLFARLLHIPIAHRAVAQVNDETGVAAVLVVAVPEDRGQLI